jgi:hypothetical protein
MEAGGIYVAYQRCCRNAALSNIADPIAAGATYFVHIPEPSVTDCNSSPRFTTELNAKLCYGYSYLFDGSAFDPDGDSLTYRTFTPFLGGSQINPIPITPDPPPYSQVTYAAPFTSEYPINSIPPYELDKHTGMIAVTPSSFGTFLICLAVTEYRNGLEIGTVFRDFEWIVSDVTGTDLIANFNDMKLEPNPFSDFVSLTSPFQSTSKLMVTDSRGKVVLKKSLQPLEKISIDETELGTEGILFFRLISEEGKVTTAKAVHLH